MIVETTVSVATLLNWSKIISGVLGLLSVIFGAFKVITWIKTKLTNIDANVVELKKSIDVHIGGLRDDVKEQTNTLANELREQRQDFRTFYAPTLIQMQNLLQPTNQPKASPVRAKRNTSRKKR